MDQAVSKTSFPEVKHHKNESKLHKRRPSKEEDEKLLSQFPNSLHAAKLRSALPEDKLHTLHNPVEFSWRQFWVTMLYENLPPVLIAPLAVLLVERSLSRAWHVMNHRCLFVCSRKHNSRGNHIFFWVFFYPIYWMITLALLLRFFAPEAVVLNVDLFQISLAYLFFSLRALIVSAKYGYYRPEDYAQLHRPAPNWSEAQTNRRLVGGGWTNPANFPGLIEDELICAMDENDVALQGISFKMDKETSSRLRKHSTDELFTAETGCNEKDEVTTGFILHQILSSVYNLKFPPIYSLSFLILALAIMLCTFLIRLSYGLNTFGDASLEVFIFIGCLLGFFFGSLGNLNFGMICAHDFNRRATTLKILGRLIQYPGVRLSELLFHKPNPEEKEKDKESTKSTMQESSTGEPNDPYVYIDIKKPGNVFAWMICRKTLRSFGEIFYLRIQAYTSILLSYAILCVLFLNVIAWTQTRHHVSTIWLLIIIVFSISAVCVFAISKATKLQTLSSDQRDQVQKELFFLEKELMDAENADKTLEFKQFSQAKVLLQQVDESINFHELIHKPTKVMGYAATQSVISSALGIILTGFVLAVEGFSGSGISYDLNGWFNY
ncbi:MAG: hypothetical protein HN351_06320 [Deltaproteobacteria bacterium]|jgi:multisubunit Na+/H+ antiporter MnhG subunit|nr:hypothetical protein [Deltaproteobacteria bacterium]